MKAQRVRLAWKSKITDKEGHCKYTTDKDTVLQLIEVYNEIFPQSDHWLEYEEKDLKCNEKR